MPPPIAITSEAPPLRMDESGALRVGDSRVLLELVIGEFLDAATPEEIVQEYPTTSLADVYAVIAYYLRHQAEINGYLTDRERLGNELQARLKLRQGDLTEIRERLRSRSHK